MKHSIELIKGELYKLTIAPSTADEINLMQKPNSEIKGYIYQYFDEAVKEKFGGKAYIASIKENKDFPYQIIAYISERIDIK